MLVRVPVYVRERGSARKRRREREGESEREADVDREGVMVEAGREATETTDTRGRIEIEF